MLTKKIILTRIQQLVDLNDDTKNFELAFTAKSKNKEPFQMVIVDQDTLDNTPALEYKYVNNGIISGNIKNDNDKYKNFYVCLKSEKTCEVEITIDKKEIEPKAQQEKKLNKYTEKGSTKEVVKESNNNSTFKFLMYIVIICIIAGIIFFFNWKKSVPTAAIESMSIPNFSDKRVIPPPDNNFHFGNVSTPTLIDRLNNLETN